MYIVVMEPQLFKVIQNVIIRNSTGNILILRHITGKWLLPGGKINKGENWIDGLRRELSEELGISDFQLKAILDTDSWIENGQGCFVITYLIESILNPQVILSNEHSEYAWVSYEELGEYEFWHPKIIERIKKAFY